MPSGKDGKWLNSFGPGRRYLPTFSFNKQGTDFGCVLFFNIFYDYFKNKGRIEEGLVEV